jgi:hypothetical protein
MAKSNKEIIVRVGANTAEFNKAMKGLNSNMFGMSKQMASFGKIFSGVFAAGSIVEFGRAAIKNAEEQEVVNNRLMHALKNNKTAYEQLTRQAEKLRKDTGVDDAAIMQIQTLGAAAGYSTNKIMKITQASIDLAAVTKQDLQSSYMQVNQTYNGTAGRLTRLDAEFGTLTKEQLKNGAGVDLLISKYGGFAKSSITETQRLISTWDEFSEKMGTITLPIINKVFGQLNKDLTVMSDNSLTFWERWTKSQDELLKIINERSQIADGFPEATKAAITYYDTIIGKNAAIKGLSALIDTDNGKLGAVILPPKKPGSDPKSKEPTSELSEAQRQATAHYNSMLVLQKVWREKSVEVEKDFNETLAVFAENARNINIEGFQQTGEALQTYLDDYASAQSEYYSMTTDQYQQDADKFKLMLDQKLISQQQYNEMMAMLNEQEKQARLNQIADMIGQTASLFGQQTIAFKTLAIAQATINTWAAATAALAPPPLGAGPILGPFLAATAIASGLANVAKISGVELAEGGVVPAGYPNDSYPAMLTSDETVIPAKKLPDFQNQHIELTATIKAGDIHLSNKRGEYLKKRRG